MTAVVHVRWAEPRLADEANAWLDATESARLVRLRRPDDRARFVGSRAGLKALVASLTGVAPADVALRYDCEQCGQQHGRPVLVGSLADSGWAVSLSHAGQRVLVAATREGPVGADVEPVAAVDFSGFAEVALAPAEQQSIAALPAAERRLAAARIWVRKEALLKASGAGLRVDPREVDTIRSARGASVADLDVGARYAAAVALASRTTFTVQMAGPVTVAAAADRAAQRSRATGGTAR
jgi:4'-phosphopantetheinyl transferase